MKKVLNWVNPYTLSVLTIGVFCAIVVTHYVDSTEAQKRLDHINTLETSVKIKSKKPRVIYKYRDILPQTLVFESPVTQVTIFSEKGRVLIDTSYSNKR